MNTVRKKHYSKYHQKTVHKSNDKKSNIVKYPYPVNKDIIKIRYQLQEQKKFFSSGKTKEVSFRIKQLKLLRKMIKDNEEKILNALYYDLKKPEQEAYLAEIGILYQEINHTLKHIKKWSKKKSVKTPWMFQPARSWIKPEPYGQVLILGPWNYPFQLTIAPLIAAISAGNVSVLKPSELAPATSKLIKEIISQTFDSSFVFVAEGGVEVSKSLLEEKYDHIFFTGGTEVGKIIMEKAAQNLTPVTLELGGKSPVIVNNDAKINQAAKKIVWGKFMNAGQTCLAPDYLLVHRDVKNELIERIKFYIKEFYGDDPESSKDYARIINQKHFKRLRSLMKDGRIIHGGTKNMRDLYIEPTLVANIRDNARLMSEEIFGPILPIVEFNFLDEVITKIKSRPKPLALYLFTNNKKIEKRILEEISSGGVVINDTILHVGNHYLPFGGVGHSGIGSYHGKFGFDTFSHKKAVFKKPSFFDIPFRYPPYKRIPDLIKRFIE